MPVRNPPSSLLDAETRPQSASRLSLGSPVAPGLTILWHPDLSRVGEQAALTALAAGRPEPLSRREPAFGPPGEPASRPLADPYVSRSPIWIAPGSAAGSVRLRNEVGTPLAVFDEGIGEPTAQPAAGEPREISAAEIEHGVVLLLANRVTLLLHFLDPLGAPEVPHFGLVGESLAVVQLRREISQVAALEVSVLLRGATGTGKELVARALHEAGPRSRAPYLAVNMGAIPASLAAAELFGAARGAFTGAERKREGWFSRAHGGTLFLDEVGETPLEVQALLLRALANGEIQPVGGDEVTRVDVRLIAATDAELEAAVAAGKFRAPLLHRLGGYEIFVPPLARRRDDIGRLLLHFLRQELAAVGQEARLAPRRPEERPWLPAATVARLVAHDWPGNVRQLQNVALRIVVAGRDANEVPKGDWIERLLAESAGAPPTPTPPTPSAGPAGSGEALPPPRAPRKVYRRPEEIGDEEILAALRAHRFRLQPTAAALGIARTSLYDKIENSSLFHKAAALSRQEIEQWLARCGGDLDRMVEGLEVSKRGLQRRMKQLGMV
jgi:two-component system nitrogen regulation response regulator GlnG